MSWTKVKEHDNQSHHSEFIMDNRDIARLVMGYLREDCLDTAAIFAASSPHLYEFRVQTFRNENPSTTVYNMTLSNILQEFRAIHNYIKNKHRKLNGLQSVYNSNNVIKNLQVIINQNHLTGSDHNDITTLYDSREANAGTLEKGNAEDEKSKDAQLVLGYLNDECPTATASFVAKSQNLSEYRLQLFQNKPPSTPLNGVTLNNILQQYCSILTSIQTILKSAIGPKAVCRPGNVVQDLEKIISKKRRQSIDNQPKQAKLLKNTTGRSEKLRTRLKLTKKKETLLNAAFQDSSYVSGYKRRFLAVETGLTEMQVKQWFQEKRNIANRELLHVQNIVSTVDSSAMICEPGPSTYRSFENEISICSPSSSTQSVRPPFL